VRNAPEKVFVLDFAQFMPPTLVARRIEDVRASKAVGRGRLPAIWSSSRSTAMAVGGVPRARRGDNLGALVEVFSQMWPEPYMVQPFLPDVAKGDKRIVLVDGVVAGAINRRPGAGEFRSNLAVGGSAGGDELTARGGNLRRAGAGVEEARAHFRGHRRDRRRVADRDQRDRPRASWRSSALMAWMWPG
jgi:glutathione synthase